MRGQAEVVVYSDRLGNSRKRRITGIKKQKPTYVTWRLQNICCEKGKESETSQRLLSEETVPNEKLQSSKQNRRLAGVFCIHNLEKKKFNPLLHDMGLAK